MNPIETETRSQTYQLIIAGLTFIACCGLFYAYLIHPLRKEADQVQSNISKLELVLTKRDAEEVRLANSLALVDMRKEHLDQVMTTLEKQPIRILAAAQSLASANQIVFSWRTAGNKPMDSNNEPGDDVRFQLVTLDLEGKYNNLRDYFEGMRGLDCLLKFESFEIKATKKTRDDSIILQAKVMLQVPFSESRHDENTTIP